MGEKYDALTVMEMKVDSDDRWNSNTKTSTSGSMILRIHQCFYVENRNITYYLFLTGMILIQLAN